jgi:hypothetical protein
LESIYELAGATQRRVDFVNLPPQCTIRIFTASGKLVRKLEHDSAEDFGRETWDLTTDDGPEIAFGVYFFVVEAEGLGVSRVSCRDKIRFLSRITLPKDAFGKL